VRRIREISEKEPELLVSHCYTRYLGDLSGGQIFKGIAQTAMNLPDGEGIAFYEFAEIPDAKAFKANYRQTLDELPIDDAGCDSEALLREAKLPLHRSADRIVDEANAAFDMNGKMYQELEGNLIEAIGQMLYNTLTRRRTRGSTELATAE
jgi:heme oxygenase